MRRVPLLLLPLLLPLLAASPALADRVFLRNGRVVEGEVREDGDALVVRTASGIEARLPRDTVLRVEAGPTPAATFRARLDALAPDDLAGHHDLARWCDAEGLSRDARAVRERVLERWPDDLEARAALGWLWHEGEWITREGYMERLGLVPAEGGRTWTTPDEAERRADAEHARSRAPEVERALRLAATDAGEAARAVAAFDDLTALRVLQDAVRADGVAVRLLAIDELGRRAAPDAAPVLARAAVEDPSRAARERALAALRAVPHRGVEAYFVRALRREHAFQRVHAVAAVGAFPSRAAVPALITVLRESTGGFGRCHITIVTQQAYIADFELSSGGTGLVVAEVADPQVETLTTGVNLDTRVLTWERRTVLSTLRQVTGQDLGEDPGAWERWWRDAGPGFEPPRP